MAVAIIRTNWTGTTGGPGITQIALTEYLGSGDEGFWTPAKAQSAVDAMRGVWDAIKAYIPNEITLSVSPTVDVYDVVSGDLVASATAPIVPINIAGGDVGAYSMASGMKATFATGVIRNGRRVKGCMYIVPAGSTAQTVFGLAATAAKTAVNNAGTAFIAALFGATMVQVVYSRPVDADATATPPVVARDGAIATVTSWDTNEKLAILRGRRD